MRSQRPCGRRRATRQKSDKLIRYRLNSTAWFVDTAAALATSDLRASLGSLARPQATGESRLIALESVLLHK